MNLFLAIGIIFIAGCAPSLSEKKTLRLAFQTPPTTFDPRKSGDFTSATLICLLYEGLTRCIAGGNIQMALAQSVDISKEGCLYTFHLRQAYWSDGHPVTAQDFEYAWKKVVDPSFPSPSAHLLLPIKNGEKCIQGLLPPSDLGVTAAKPDTLVVELERPTPYFLSLTAFPLFLPFPSHLQSPPTDFPVCNGPFLLENFSPNQEIQLQKNPTFWNAEHININAIHISLISSETTTLHLFEKGELDWLGAPLAPLPPDAIPTLKTKGKLHTAPMAASTFLSFNTKSALFQNIHLRKALSLALDRETLVKELFLTGQIPAKRILPPSLSSENAPALLHYDPEEAKQHLALALEELQIPVQRLEALILYYKTGQSEKQLAQIIQKEWKDKLGFTIQIEQTDPKTHIDRLHQKDYEIALASWIAQFHDPISILERFRLPSNPKNFSIWENKDYIQLLNESTKALDPKQRYCLLEEAERLLAAEIPVAPIYHWSCLSISHPRVKDIGATPSGGILFEWFSLEDTL